MICLRTHRKCVNQNSKPDLFDSKIQPLSHMSLDKTPDLDEAQLPSLSHGESSCATGIKVKTDHKWQLVLCPDTPFPGRISHFCSTVFISQQILILIFIDHRLCARSSTEHFTYINSFNPSSSPIGQVPACRLIVRILIYVLYPWHYFTLDQSDSFYL